jgi:hypothetical protein
VAIELEVVNGPVELVDAVHRVAWRLSDDLSTRLFTHSDDARYRVGA